jgi:two-component system sensor histidine kinase UhpB
MNDSTAAFPHFDSLAFQIVAFPVAVLVVWFAAALTFMVADARDRIQSEVSSSTALARAMMESAVDSLQEGLDPASALDRLKRLSPHVRHVRIAVAPSLDDVAAASVFPSADAESAVPGWFVRLVGLPQGLETLKLPVAPLGYVFIEPNPADEIDEIWRDFLYLSAICGSATLANAAAVFLVFARTRRPIRALAEGLECLEHGDFTTLLPPARLYELEPIRDRFNRLAGSLVASEAENRMLYQRVVSLAESERKAIARELHDELGPCLFGIRAETASIVDIAAALSPCESEIPARARAINAIVDAVQQINRRVLEALRPVTLAELGLAAALRDLIDNWQERNPSTFVSLDAAEAELEGLDEPVALAVYRIVQECLTNVARHALADFAEIVLNREPAEASNGPHRGLDIDAIRLLVTDNGRGFVNGTKRGLGLRGVEERVRGLGGKVTVTGEAGRGVAVDVWLPLGSVAA